MKVVVDFDRCESNGLCEEVCPHVFHIDSDGFLQVDQSAARADDEDLQDAARICPRSAITLED